MRRNIAIFLIINILTVAFLIHSFWPLICLLFVTGLEDQISRAELPAPLSDSIDVIELVVPKIIHQTFITCDVPLLLNGTCTTNNIPGMWDGAQNSCKDLHPDYEYMFWQDQNARDFIVAKYPWFVSVWDSYTYPIQRADAIRYFALEHYGGVYIDLDDGCKRRLDPLLTYPAWVRRSHPTGIGNDVIGVIPHHPFIRRVIDSLPRYNHHWFSPYITIMSSTGPLFFSLIWQHYSKGDGIGNALLRSGLAGTGERLLGAYGAGVPSGDQRVRILFADEYMGTSWSFFSHHMGNSWHMWDAKAIFWMSSHWLELTVFGFIAGFAVIFGLYCLFNAASTGRGCCGRAGSRRALPSPWLSVRNLFPSVNRIRYTRLSDWNWRKEQYMELGEVYEQ